MAPPEPRDDHETNEYIERYMLPTSIKGDCVEHRVPYSSRSRGIRRGIRTRIWKTEQELGRGGFGVVRLQRETKSGKLRAVKEVVRSEAAAIDPLRELTAMAALAKDEANFVKLHGWYEHESLLYIAMEYFPLGDLAMHVKEPLPEGDVQSVIFQVTEAVLFMHSRNFTHRDLKPSNIFVAQGGPNWWVKLADFGVSKRCKGNTALHTLLSGDTDFTAPELLGFTDTVTVTDAVDMWSVGCLAAWLLTQDVLLQTQNMFAFSTGRFNLPITKLTTKSVSESGVDFVTNLIKHKPDERLNAETALNHAWLEAPARSPDSDDNISVMSSDSTMSTATIRATNTKENVLNAKDHDVATDIGDQTQALQKSYPRAGRTKMPKRFAHSRALDELGYNWVHHDEKHFLVHLALGKEQIDEIIARSKEYLEADPQSKTNSTAPSVSRSTTMPLGGSDKPHDGHSRTKPDSRDDSRAPMRTSTPRARSRSPETSRKSTTSYASALGIGATLAAHAAHTLLANKKKKQDKNKRRERSSKLASAQVSSEDDSEYETLPKKPPQDSSSDGDDSIRAVFSGQDSLDEKWQRHHRTTEDYIAASLRGPRPPTEAETYREPRQEVLSSRSSPANAPHALRPHSMPEIHENLREGDALNLTSEQSRNSNVEGNARSSFGNGVSYALPRQETPAWWARVPWELGRTASLTQLNRMSHDFHVQLRPMIEDFLRSPPPSRDDRDRQYRRLNEMAYQTVYESGDSIIINDDDPYRDRVRSKRKTLYDEAQEILNQLDRFKPGSREREQWEEQYRASQENGRSVSSDDSAKTTTRSQTQSIPAIHEISEEEEREFQRKVEERLLRAGYSRDYINDYLDKLKPGSKPSIDCPRPQYIDPTQPTYIKVHTRYMVPETLDAYNLPWMYDPTDAKYIIIQEYVNYELQNELFEHSKKLMARGKATRNKSPPGNPPRPTYIKIHTQYLLPETVEYYHLPWEYDPADPQYIIIKEYLSHELTEVLFAHSKRLMKQGRRPPQGMSGGTTFNGTMEDRFTEFAASAAAPTQDDKDPSAERGEMRYTVGDSSDPVGPAPAPIYRHRQSKSDKLNAEALPERTRRTAGGGNKSSQNQTHSSSQEKQDKKQKAPRRDWLDHLRRP